MMNAPKGIYLVSLFLLILAIAISAAELLLVREPRWLTFAYSVAYVVVAVGLVAQKSIARIATLCLLFPVVLLTGIPLLPLIMVNLLGTTSIEGIVTIVAFLVVLLMTLKIFGYLRQANTQRWFSGDAPSQKNEFFIVILAFILQAIVACVDFFVL